MHPWDVDFQMFGNTWKKVYDGGLDGIKIFDCNPFSNSPSGVIFLRSALFGYPTK